jgi:hypothetical protein
LLPGLYRENPKHIKTSQIFSFRPVRSILLAPDPMGRAQTKKQPIWLLLGNFGDSRPTDGSPLVGMMDLSAHLYCYVNFTEPRRIHVDCMKKSFS